MSFYTQSQKGQLSIKSVVEAVEAALSTQTAVMNNPAISSGILTHESFDSMRSDEQDAIVQAEEIVDAALRNSGLDQLITLRMGPRADKEVVAKAIEKAYELAGLTLLASGNPSAWMDAQINAASWTPSNNQQALGNVAASELTHESFEKRDLTDLVVFSAISYALTVVTNPLGDTFYKTVVLPPSKPGIEIKIQIPHIYSNKSRSSNGDRFELVRRPIIHALSDSTILESNSNVVWPYAAPDGSNDAHLAPKAASADGVADRVKTLAGVAVPTRPLKVNDLVDLVSISGHPALLKGEVQDATDMLDANVQVRSFFFKIGDGVATGIVEKEVLNQFGTMFFPKYDGRQYDTVMAYKGEVYISSSDVLEDGATVTAGLPALAVAAGLGADTPYQIKLSVEAFGTLENDLHNIRVSQISAELSTVLTKDADGKWVENEAATAAFAGITTAAGLYWFPKAVRTQANMRDNSIVCEVGNVMTYVIPVRPGAVMTTINPIQGAGDAASMDAVSMNLRAVQANQSITELLAFRDMLAASAEIGGNATVAIGAQLVNPTYIHQYLDIPVDVKSNKSRDAMSDLRNLLVNSVTMMANRLILSSRYLNALFMLSGSMSNFEVIVGTDPLIANHLMLEGDGRTIGNDRKFSIGYSLDERVTNRIFVSLRRTDTEGADPLSFGVFATSPALLYTAQTTRNGRVAKEMHMVPRNQNTPLLPILGEIEVRNLDELFAKSI